jgi:hypothetical protein
MGTIASVYDDGRMLDVGSEDGVTKSRKPAALGDLLHLRRGGRRVREASGAEELFELSV